MIRTSFQSAASSGISELPGSKILTIFQRSLNILLIAWYHPPEYWNYLDWCQRTNLEIMKRFEKEEIEFAFPTSTTYLAGDPKRPLAPAAGAKKQGLVGTVKKALRRSKR